MGETFESRSVCIYWYIYIHINWVNSIVYVVSYPQKPLYYCQSPLRWQGNVTSVGCLITSDPPYGFSSHELGCLHLDSTGFMVSRCILYILYGVNGFSNVSLVLFGVCFFHMEVICKETASDVVLGRSIWTMVRLGVKMTVVNWECSLKAMGWKIEIRSEDLSMKGKSSN